MRVLGLSAGNPDGSAEILIKIALGSAAEAGADVALVRLDDVSLPTRPVGPGRRATGEDDGGWLWDQLMDSDGLIVSAPIYSRTVPGKLKLVADRLSGPAADVAFAENYRRMLEGGRDPAGCVPLRRAGVPPARGRPDRRRGRAHQPVEVAGAAAHAPDDAFSAHMAVADQLARRRRGDAAGRWCSTRPRWWRPRASAAASGEAASTGPAVRRGAVPRGSRPVPPLPPVDRLGSGRRRRVRHVWGRRAPGCRGGGRRRALRRSGGPRAVGDCACREARALPRGAGRTAGAQGALAERDLRGASSIYERFDCLITPRSGPRRACPGGRRPQRQRPWDTRSTSR